VVFLELEFTQFDGLRVFRNGMFVVPSLGALLALPIVGVRLLGGRPTICPNSGCRPGKCRYGFWASLVDPLKGCGTSLSLPWACVVAYRPE
jgi:hypothetical protein